MNRKKFALLLILSLTLFAFTTSFAQLKQNSQKPATQTNNALAALLPASDGAVNIDLKRLMNESLPQILSANPDMLTEINSKIADVQTKTGIDLRQFEQMSVGVNFKQISPKEIDYDPLILARGKFNAGALLETAKSAAKDKYHEEKIGDKSVYIFPVQEIVQENKPQMNNSKLGKMVDRALNSLKNEIAVTVYDDNTLALGTLARVREMLTTKTKISPGLLAYLNRKPSAILTFAANTKTGLQPFFNLDNDEIGNILAGVRTVYGSLDSANGNVIVAVTAKSADLQKAKDLEEAVTGLQMVGKGLLSASKGKDKEVYARMIDNAKITRNATEVSLDLQVPQTDINILLGKK